MGLTKVLVGILSCATLLKPALAFNAPPPDPQTYSLSLTWDPSPSPDVVGYHFYYGAESGNYTNSIVTSNVTTATISGLSTGVTYYFALTAVAADGQESDFSNEVNYINPSTNNPPNVVFTASAEGTGYTAPATITLAATVTSNGYTISNVQFYDGATLLGEAGSEPYSFVWSNVSTGNYNLTARAVYDAGSTIDSLPVSITITDPSRVQLQFTPNGQVVLTVTGSAGHTYDFEATEDFTTWTVIGTVTVDASGSFDFTDTNAADFPQRFYRTRDTQP